MHTCWHGTSSVCVGYHCVVSVVDHVTKIKRDTINEYLYNKVSTIGGRRGEEGRERGRRGGKGGRRGGRRRGGRRGGKGGR